MEVKLSIEYFTLKLMLMICKILGSLLDTEKDIERRKALTFNVFNKFKYTLQSKRISQSIKIRIFVAYIQCVLYVGKVLILE